MYKKIKSKRLLLTILVSWIIAGIGAVLTSLFLTVEVQKEVLWQAYIILFGLVIVVWFSLLIFVPAKEQVTREVIMKFLEDERVDIPLNPDHFKDYRFNDVEVEVRGQELNFVRIGTHYLYGVSKEKKEEKEAK